MLGYPPIYIICHKRDYFLTRIAVASIRYYYPDIEIVLIKDYLNGNFSTKDLEKYFHVKVLPLGNRKYGWTSAKIFLLLSKKLKDKKIFLLDPDVVFVGNVVDILMPYISKYDFIVSPKHHTNPGQQSFANLFYDYSLIKKKYPRLRFPGFVFNTGCMVITAGSLRASDIKAFFDTSRYPYWTPLAGSLLPTRDQSLLNILLPMKALARDIRWKQIPCMWWFRETEVKRLTIDEVKTGKYPFVIHWAGGKRLPYLPAMERGDIMDFFQKFYFSHLPFGTFRYVTSLLKEAVIYFCWIRPRDMLGIEKITDWPVENSEYTDKLLNV